MFWIQIFTLTLLYILEQNKLYCANYNVGNLILCSASEMTSMLKEVNMSHLSSLVSNSDSIHQI